MITSVKVAIGISSDVLKLKFSLLSAMYQLFRRSTCSLMMRCRDEILGGDQISAAEIQAILILSISFSLSYASTSIERKMDVRA